jgi:RHH-type transcriptional regulator, rel operon repressor / antitoxin RelB
MNTSTITIQLPQDITTQYDVLAQATGRSRETLIGEALQEYLVREVEDLARIAQAVAQADRGEFVTDEEMEGLFTEFGGTPDQRAVLRTAMDESLRTAYSLPACE